jgi:hypothetical protein
VDIAVLHERGFEDGALAEIVEREAGGISTLLERVEPSVDLERHLLLRDGHDLAAVEDGRQALRELLKLFVGTQEGEHRLAHLGRVVPRCLVQHDADFRMGLGERAERENIAPDLVDDFSEPHSCCPFGRGCAPIYDSRIFMRGVAGFSAARQEDCLRTVTSPPESSQP